MSFPVLDTLFPHYVIPSDDDDNNDEKKKKMMLVRDKLSFSNIFYFVFLFLNFQELLTKKCFSLYFT